MTKKQHHPGTGARRKWYHFWKADTPDPPAPKINARDYEIRVLASDLYDPKKNLIEHVIWDEEQFKEELVVAEEAAPKKRSKKSKFLDLLIEEVGALAGKLTSINRRIETVEESGSELDQGIRKVRSEIEDIKRSASSEKQIPPEALDNALAQIEKIRQEYAGREQLDEVRAKVEEISAKYVDRGQLDDISDKIRKESADRELLEKLGDRVEKIGAKSVDRKLVDELSKKIEQVRVAADPELINQALGRIEKIGAKSVDRKLVDELSERIEQVREESADPELIDKALARIEEISATSADRKLVDELSEKIEQVREESADPELVNKALDRIEKIGAASADINLIDELSERIEEVREASVERKTMDQALARIKKIGAASADRQLVGELSEKIEQVREASAERELLDQALARIEKINARYADREVTDELSAQLQQIQSKYTGRALLDKIIDHVEVIGSRFAERSLLSNVVERIDEIDSSYAGREALDDLLARIEKIQADSADKETLDGLLAQVDELSKKSADSKLVYKVVTQLEDIREKVEEAELARQALDQRLEESLQTGAGQEEQLLDDFMKRLSELEAGAGELHALAAQSMLSADMEGRLSNLERELSEVSSPAPAGEQSPGAPVQGLDKAFSRIKTIEGEHKDLKRQIRKAFENLEAHPLAELDAVKKQLSSMQDLQGRLKELDAIKRQLAKMELMRIQSTPPRAVARSKPSAMIGAVSAAVASVVSGVVAGAKSGATSGGMSGAKLFLIMVPAFLIAISIGIVTALWVWEPYEPDGSAQEEVIATAPDAPNFVYDISQALLAPPTLDLGTEWLTLKDGKLDITGYAPGAVHSYLYLNNNEVGYMAVEDQGFNFEQVVLNYGVNVIEVKVVDAEGNEANSMAGIVERQSQSMAKVRTTSFINRMRGPRELPFIALTIDAGASSRRSGKILDVLIEKQIVTTFFLTGQFVEKHPEIVQRIVDDGHEIGNHTYSHPHLTTFEKNWRHHTSPGVNREMVREELRRTRKLFESLTGTKMSHWWRAPYGEHNREILGWAEEEGFKHIDWTRTPTNHDMLDWVSNEKSKYYLDHQALYERLTDIDAGVAGKANGGIILMHLGTDRHKDFIDEVLPLAIDELRSRDYEFVTVSRMFSK